MTVTLTVKNLDVSVDQATPGFWQGADFLTSPDWTIVNRVGDLGNSELQGYLPEQFSVDGPYLRIDTEIKPAHGMGYASGMMQFTPGYAFEYGSIEYRMKMATLGTGTWPAVWLLGAGCQATNPVTADNGGTCNWPQIGSESDEIDLSEFGGLDRTNMNFQIHNNLGNDQRVGAIGFDAAADFHKYRFERAPGIIAMYLDDSPTPWATITNNLSDTPMGLIINVAVGGIGGGTPVPATFPSYTLIDYVHLVPA